MKMKSDLSDEIKEGLSSVLVALLIIILVAAIIFGLFYIIPTPKKACLDSENPRRFISKTYTCQEYLDGQWVKVDSSIEYNETWKEGRIDE